MKSAATLSIISSIVFAMIISLGLVQPVFAEYPEKPINLIVAHKAGGMADTASRILAKSLQDQLGQPVLVVNKPGGGGLKGAMTVMKSPADGYNLVMTTTATYTFMPHFMAEQKKAVLNWDSLAHLATVADFQGAYVGPPSIKTWEELLQLGKQKGELTVASLSQIDAMISRYIGRKEGINIKAVPFKGGAGTMTALLGNHVDFAFSGGLHAKYVSAGQMITLAATSFDGLVAEPKVPTLEQLGYEGIGGPAAMIVSVTKGTPDKIQLKLEQAIKQAVESKDYKELMSNVQMPIIFRGIEETNNYTSDVYASMKKLFDSLK